VTELHLIGICKSRDRERERERAREPSPIASLAHPQVSQDTQRHRIHKERERKRKLYRIAKRQTMASKATQPTKDTQPAPSEQQGMPTPKPEEAAEESYSEVAARLKRSPKGFGALGTDGVLRTIDSDHTVLDAVGLSPGQIREYLVRVCNVTDDLGPFAGVDGRSVTRDAMFHPAEGILPRKLTPEEKAARRRLIDEENRRRKEDEEMVDRMVFPEVD
jgi:hypothetical protein